MSYRHDYRNVLMTATAVALNSTGVLNQKYFPGYMPEQIRGFWLVNTTTLPNVSSCVAVLQRRSLDVATTATTIATLNPTATGGVGVMFYTATLNFEVGPGDQVEIDITDAATVAAVGALGMYVSARWETAANATNAKATT